MLCIEVKFKYTLSSNPLGVSGLKTFLGEELSTEIDLFIVVFNGRNNVSF